MTRRFFHKLKRKSTIQGFERRLKKILRHELNTSQSLLESDEVEGPSFENRERTYIFVRVTNRRSICRARKLSFANWHS